MSAQPLTQSEFAMWRAVFAFAYVDNTLSLEEQELLQSFLATVPFTNSQRIILKEDLRAPKNAVDLYRAITDKKDKERFCILARAIVWCEGDMSAQEREILKRVSCLADAGEEEILKSTRGHAYVEEYYRCYARAGVSGLAKYPPIVEIRA